MMDITYHDDLFKYREYTSVDASCYLNVKNEDDK